MLVKYNSSDSILCFEAAAAQKTEISHGPKSFAALKSPRAQQGTIGSSYFYWLARQADNHEEIGYA